jgi:hypothetical protein
MKYPDTWVETPIFDAGKVSKATSDRSAMVSAVPKERADTDAIREFLTSRGITRPTAEQQRACDVAANKRNQGRKDIEAVMAGWSSHRAARAMPSLAEIEALAAGCGMWGTGDRPLGEKGDTKVSFPKVRKEIAPVFTLPVEPIVIPGRCAECGGVIPPKMKAGTKFCCKDHEQTNRRSRNAKILAGLAFKGGVPQVASQAAAEMRRCAERSGLEGLSFLGTPLGVLVDGELPDIIFEDERDRRRDNRVECHETEYRLSDPDILTMVMDLRQRAVARSRGYDRDYLARFGHLHLAPIDAFLTGPDRKMKLLAFDPGVELRCRLDSAMAQETRDFIGSGPAATQETPGFIGFC